jgi:hypothetical protein
MKGGLQVLIDIFRPVNSIGCLYNKQDYLLKKDATLLFL